MATSFEDLRVLQTAESIADGIWKSVVGWETFARDVVGKQLTRSADSIGANIAESYGRYHYGEKLQFLYFARGSLFETKYWLNRTIARQLMPENEVQEYAHQLSDLAYKLNLFAASIRRQRSKSSSSTKQIRENLLEYSPFNAILSDIFLHDDSQELFTAADFAFIIDRLNSDNIQ